VFNQGLLAKSFMHLLLLNFSINFKILD